MSQLKFEEKEAEEDLLKAALFVEEGQGVEEGAPHRNTSGCQCLVVTIEDCTVLQLYIWRIW